MAPDYYDGIQIVRKFIYELQNQNIYNIKFTVPLISSDDEDQNAPSGLLHLEDHLSL